MKSLTICNYMSHLDALQWVQLQRTYRTGRQRHSYKIAKVGTDCIFFQHSSYESVCLCTILIPTITISHKWKSTQLYLTWEQRVNASHYHEPEIQSLSRLISALAIFANCAKAAVPLLGNHYTLLYFIL